MGLNSVLFQKWRSARKKRKELKSIYKKEFEKELDKLRLQKIKVVAKQRARQRVYPTYPTRSPIEMWSEFGTPMKIQKVSIPKIKARKIKRRKKRR